MPPKPRLSEDLKQRIVDAHLEDPEVSFGALSQRFSTAKTTVQRIIANYKKRGSVTNLSSGGRPRKTSARTDRQITREAKKDPFITAGEFGFFHIHYFWFGINLKTSNFRLSFAEHFGPVYEQILMFGISRLESTYLI